MRLVNLALMLTIAVLVVTIFARTDWDEPGVDGTSYRLSDVGPSEGNRLRHYPTRGDDDLAERGAAALAEISYPWRQLLPEWEIQFLSGEVGAYGYTLTRENRIDIYVREDQSHELLAHVVAHEIGHAVDVTLNDSDDRARWQAMRDIEGEPWWPDNRAADFATGAGDFAESFAAWQVGPDSFRSQLGEAPNEAELALLAELAAG